MAPLKSRRHDSPSEFQAASDLDASKRQRNVKKEHSLRVGRLGEKGNKNRSSIGGAYAIISLKRREEAARAEVRTMWLTSAAKRLLLSGHRV